MADKRCDNGHFIDEAWDICPYCPGDSSEPQIPVVRPRGTDAAGPPPAHHPVAAPSPARAIARAATAPGSYAASVVQSPPMERTVAASKIDPRKLDAHKRYVVGWLVALNGASRGEAFAVRMGRNVIGRDRRSDIAIDDDQASAHHADLVFRPEERRFILMDHNSTNGTYVNESEIEPRRDLAAKDVIRIGSHKMLFTPLCHDGFHWDDEGLLQ